MWVELSPPLLAALFAVLVVALVAGVVRGTGGLRRLPLRPLDERLEPACVAERLVDAVTQRPGLAVAEDVHGIPVVIAPSQVIHRLVVRPAWRVSVGRHLDVARDADELYATIATRLSSIEAERARVVTRG